MHSILLTRRISATVEFEPTDSITYLIILNEDMDDQTDLIGLNLDYNYRRNCSLPLQIFSAFPNQLSYFSLLGFSLFQNTGVFEGTRTKNIN